MDIFDKPQLKGLQFVEAYTAAISNDDEFRKWLSNTYTNLANDKGCVTPLAPTYIDIDLTGLEWMWAIDGVGQDQDTFDTLLRRLKDGIKGSTEANAEYLEDYKERLAEDSDEWDDDLSERVNGEEWGHRVFVKALLAIGAWLNFVGPTQAEGKIKTSPKSKEERRAIFEKAVTDFLEEKRFWEPYKHPHYEDLEKHRLEMNVVMNKSLASFAYNEGK